jgi:hypothetical protein
MDPRVETVVCCVICLIAYVAWLAWTIFNDIPGDGDGPDLES